MKITLPLLLLCTIATPYAFAEPPWGFRGLRPGLPRATVDSLVARTGSPWISGEPWFDRKALRELPTIASAGRMRTSAHFCNDSFAVVARHHDSRYSGCILFSSIILDFTNDTLVELRVGFDVEGTMPTDTVVRHLIDVLSPGLPPPLMTRSEDGKGSYAGESIEGVRTYARWKGEGMEIRLIESRMGVTAVIRR